MWRALDALVAARVRSAFGGQLRLAAAGGAPMPSAVLRCCSNTPSSSCARRRWTHGFVARAIGRDCRLGMI
jgi:hypothetical protein